MPLTYQFIASTILTSSGTVTFSSIPQTYTDLHFRIMVRSADAFNIIQMYFTFNNVTTGLPYSNTALYGISTSVAGQRDGNLNTGMSPYYYTGSTSPTNNFTEYNLYIPSYTNATLNKQASSEIQAINTATTNSYLEATANRAAITSAISSVQFTNTYAIGSSFFLYGIKNS